MVGRDASLNGGVSDAVALFVVVVIFVPIVVALAACCFISIDVAAAAEADKADAPPADIPHSQQYRRQYPIVYERRCMEGVYGSYVFLIRLYVLAV